MSFDEPLTFRINQGNLKALDGATIGAVFVTGDFPQPTRAMAHVDEVALYEVDVADAPAYVRPTFLVEYVGGLGDDGEADGLVLAEGEAPTADTTGADSVAGVVFYVHQAATADADLELLSALPSVEHPGAAEDDIVLPATGLALVRPPGAGDGVLEVVAGSNVTVDSSDPLRPVVSATGGGSGASTSDELDVISDGVNVGPLTPILASLFDDVNAAEEAIAADAWLQPVRAVATSNVNIGVGGLLTVDGVTVAAGDPVLLTGQTLPAENRVAVAAVGAWTYTVVANAAYVAGAHVAVTEGTTHAGSLWRITTPNPITVGSTSITWTEFTGGGAALSDDDPADLGTADPGTSPDASRSDHVHDLPTAAAVGALATGALDTDATMAANSDAKVASQKATKTALALKAPIASPTFTGTVSGIDATMVGAVPTTRQVNGHALSADVTVTASDVGAPPTSRTVSAGTGLTGGGDLSANRSFAVSYGTTAGTAAEGNDTRITGAQQKATFPVTETIALGDETTAITTGTAKVTWRAPWAFTLTGVRASLNTASSSGIPTVNIKESGTTVLSTKLTIDASELTSVTAATAAVISDSSIADDAEITFDIDVAGTGAKGLKVTLYGTRSA